MEGRPAGTKPDDVYSKEEIKEIAERVGFTSKYQLLYQEYDRDGARNAMIGGLDLGRYARR